MLANVSGLGENSVSQAHVPSPKRIEGFANRGEISFELNFSLAAGERFEIAAEMDCNGHFL